MFLCHRSAQKQKQAVYVLLLVGQISIVLAQVLGRFPVPWLSSHTQDFLCGFLTGIALVAFAASMISYRLSAQNPGAKG